MNDVEIQAKAFFGPDPVAGQLAIDWFLDSQGPDSLLSILPLHTALGQPSFQVENRLSKLAKRIGAEAIPHLINVINEGNWHCKILASPCFAGLRGNKFAKQELVGILKKGEVDSKRIAIEALGFLGAHSLAYELVRFGRTGNWLSRSDDVSKYYFDKFYYYVLQGLIRLTAGTSDGDEIAKCLRLCLEHLDLCEKHYGTGNTYDWDIRFVLHHIGPRAAEPLLTEWVESNNQLIRNSGIEALGNLKLARTAPKLVELMDSPSMSDMSRRYAGIALSGFTHSQAAQALAERLGSNSSISQGIEWAFSTLYGLEADWPDCSELIDTLLSSSPEVAAQMRYSLALRQELIDKELVDKLNASDTFTRAASAVALARCQGEKSMEHLKDREQEAAGPLEHAMFLAAQINSGEYSKADELHVELQNVKSLHILRDVWKRELLNAFFVAEGLGSKRGALWCEVANTTADQIKTEMRRLVALQDCDKPETKKEIPESLISLAEDSRIGRHTVMLIHGIRTQAEWQQKVAAALEENSDIKVIPTRYEFLDVVRFIIPMRVFRRRAVDRIAKLIRDEYKRNNKISVIAHSFGTYIVGELLKNNSDIEFHRIILCGSIVKDDFPWDMFAGRIAPGEELDWQVLNDCGMQDIWPVMAKSMTWGYGSSGRFGFGHNRVKDRFHSKGHGDFFSPEFAKKYWLPYLRGAKITSSEIDRVPNSWWVSVLTVFKIKYLLLLLLLVLLATTLGEKILA